MTLLPSAPSEPLEEFYDRRFQSGYMRDWPAERKQRVTDVIGAAGVGRSGRALDFGCGQGVFSDVLRRALPGWTVFGSDLSPVARSIATARFPGCRFIDPDHTAASGPYDLIFTHHVLEHVEDLDAIAIELGRLLAPGGTMIHILPCGNAGSFEHDLCTRRVDGIDAGNGRFFLDEEGHLRRLTSAQLVATFATVGLRPIRQYFANQYWGALDWLTNLEIDHLKTLFDQNAATDAGAAHHLRSWRRLLIALRLLKRPPAILFRSKAAEVLGRTDWTLADRMWLVAANPAFALAFIVRRALGFLTAREWERSRTVPAGSEMFVVFRATATARGQ